MQTNAEDIAKRYETGAAALEKAVRAGVARAAFAIERAATNNLSGSGDPYSYPVPVRTGTLRRHMGVEQPAAALAIVYNGAEYAWAVHTGDANEWRSHYAGPSEDHSMMVSRRPRPFLDDAVKSTPYADMVIDGVIGALRASGDL